MPSSSPDYQEMHRRLAGEMQDDSTRRRRPRSGQPDKDIQCDCIMPQRDPVAFEDVAGNKKAKKEMIEIAKTIQEPDAYSMFGASLPKGILMTGGPGLGKTYLVRALSSELKAPFYHVQVKNVTSKWFGESEQNLAGIFDHAKKYCEKELDVDLETGECYEFDPYTYSDEREAELVDQMIEEEAEEVDPGTQNRTRLERRRRIREIREQVRLELQQREADNDNRYAIVFFDEIDALGAARENTPFQGGVSNRIVSVLLENMDGLEACPNVIVIASTNRVDAVDSALRRAGRFDRIIEVKKPGPNSRAKIFQIHFGKAEKRAEREFVDVDFNQLKEASEGLSGADIAEVVRKTCQEQAIIYRDAPEDRKEAESKVTTEQVLRVMKDYNNDLRDKDPYSTKGKIGFHAETTSKQSRDEGTVIEEDLEDDNLPTDDPDEELIPAE